MESKIKKIAVLMGGWSLEHDVSLKSGDCVSEVLESLGYDVDKIIVKKDLKHITEELYKSNPDFVFNIVHGIGGENGVLQGVLEIFGKPYSNSGVLSSALCFDKSICKKIAKTEGVRVPSEIIIKPEDISNLDTEKLPVKYPFVLKANENGSSVGVFIIFDKNDLEKIKSTKWTYGQEIIVEEYIKGREFTTLVIDGKAIGSVEITFKNKFYDYQSKYEIGGSTHISSFELSLQQMKDMHSMAEKVFKACKCKGVARADFICNDDNIYFIEINTQPGMTKLSLAPDIARFNNISIEKLIKLNIK